MLFSSTLLFNLALGELTSGDFDNLKQALQLYISENPTEIIPPLVRMSFHDLFDFDPFTGKGCPKGCLSRQSILNRTENKGIDKDVPALFEYVDRLFPSKQFSSGDVISFAGKISVEAAYPCIKVKWRFGRPECPSDDDSVASSPNGTINTLEKFQPFLTRFNLSATEMGILTAGSHGVATAAASLENTGFGNFEFAKVISGQDWIKKSVNLDWKQEMSEKDLVQFTAQSDGQTLLRLPSDLVFFPTTLQRIKATVIDQSLEKVEQYLSSFIDQDRNRFDQEFGQVYSKMLEIGTEGMNLTEYVESPTPSSNSCGDEFPYPLEYLAGWNTKNIFALCGCILSALLGFGGLIYASQ